MMSYFSSVQTKTGPVHLRCSLNIWFASFRSLTVTKRMHSILTLPSCEHQEKHEENQAQSLHVWVPMSFQTLPLTRWCCIYTAVEAQGRSPGCSVEITIAEHHWVMRVWGLKVRTVGSLSIINICSLLRIWSFFLFIMQKKHPVTACQYAKNKLVLIGHAPMAGQSS